MTTPDDPTSPRPVSREPAGTPGSDPVGAPSSVGPGSEPASASTRPAPDTPAETTSGRRRAEEPRTSPSSPSPEADVPSGGRTASVWIALILGAIVLILLLIFVIQNNHTAQFQYFNAEFDLPLGVAMLLAAIAGALVMALVGSVRMIQMGWTIRKLRKQQGRIQRAAR